LARIRLPDNSAPHLRVLAIVQPVELGPAEASPWMKRSRQSFGKHEVVTWDPLPGALRGDKRGHDLRLEAEAVACHRLPAPGHVGGAPASRVIDNRPLRAQYELMSKPWSPAPVLLRRP